MLTVKLTAILTEKVMGHQSTKNRQKTAPPLEGFTLIEVLAGILIATVFVLITTQAIAISALYRVRAQRESEAWLWIQENFERDVKFESLQAIGSKSLCSATNSSGGFGAALQTRVDAKAFNTNPVFLNKTHSASRTLVVKNTAPFNTLNVSYEVRDPGLSTSNGSNVIASFYTEVIPDAAFDCK